MASRSARISAERPFYGLYATAYDALIRDPVEPWVDSVDHCLGGVRPSPRTILDAGCGTGRHAAALTDRGYQITLLDASQALLAIAAKRCPSSPAIVADVCALELEQEFAGVMCRGVLNDLIEEQERVNAITSLAHSVQDTGTLVLDVRETSASRSRADGKWRTTVAHLPDGSCLTFRSRPSWADGRIVVDERYEISDADRAPGPAFEYTFQMRPWSREELRDRLTTAGLVHVDIRPGVGRRTPDRLLVLANR